MTIFVLLHGRTRFGEMRQDNQSQYCHHASNHMQHNYRQAGSSARRSKSPPGALGSPCQTSRRELFSTLKGPKDHRAPSTTDDLKTIKAMSPPQAIKNTKLMKKSCRQPQQHQQLHSAKDFDHWSALTYFRQTYDVTRQTEKEKK